LNKLKEFERLPISLSSTLLNFLKLVTRTTGVQQRTRRHSGRLQWQRGADRVFESFCCWWDADSHRGGVRSKSVY